MTPQRPDFSLVVERRATEAGTSPFAMSEAAAVAKPVFPVYPTEVVTRPPAALTAREERVRRMLLRELEGINKRLNQTKTWAEKKEREHVIERLDVDFLDREITKMRKQTAQTWRVVAFLGLPLLFVAFLMFYAVRDGGSDAWVMGVLHTLNMGMVAWGYVHRRNALRRKLFIYEALRALSDADEVDVILDKASREADLLIEKIVARELEAERRFPLTFSSSEYEEAPARQRTRVR